MCTPSFGLEIFSGLTFVIIKWHARKPLALSDGILALRLSVEII